MRRTKKIKHFFKTYFYFSQGERKGVLVLCLLLVLLMVVPFVSRLFYTAPDIAVSNMDVLAQAPIDSTHSFPSPTLFTFNPNTATAEELVSLGFTSKQVQTIVHYRQKGGKFRKASDLGKLYGVSPQHIEQLTPYIQIPENNHPKDSFTTSKTKVPQAPVELNTADSLEIVKLYRIGPALTHRILEFRNRLGGFVSLKQLTEIYGFDEDILFDLDGKITVDASKALIHNVNTVTVDELKTHPYFKFKLSNAIVNYRTQHGPYQELFDLRKIVIVNDSIYRNIIQYLKL